MDHAAAHDVTSDLSFDLLGDVTSAAPYGMNCGMAAALSAPVVGPDLQ